MGNHHSRSSSDASSSSKEVCDKTPFAASTTTPIAGNLQFHELNMVVSGACAAFSTITVLFLMFRHATNFSKPQEQTNILRICAFIPIYAIGTFIEICAPAAYVYVQVWLEVAQAFALASFFVLVCRFLSSEIDGHQEAFMNPLKLILSKSERDLSKVVSVYRRRWILIWQYPVVATLLAIFADIAQGADVYCFGSSKAHFASIWIEVFQKTSLGLAVTCVLMTYGQLKVELKPHRAIQKLFAFKLLIGLQFLQQIVYMILTRVTPSPLTPTATLSYTDMQIGIPLLIVSCELVIFSILFHFAYNVKLYQIYTYPQKTFSPVPSEESQTARPANGYCGGPLGIHAWLSIFNPSVFVAACRFPFTINQRALHAEDDSHRGILMNRQPSPVAEGETSHGGQQSHLSYDAYREAPPSYAN